jgi:hypothetical protein
MTVTAVRLMFNVYIYSSRFTFRISYYLPMIKFTTADSHTPQTLARSHIIQNGDDYARFNWTQTYVITAFNIKETLILVLIDMDTQLYYVPVMKSPRPRTKDGDLFIFWFCVDQLQSTVDTHNFTNYICLRNISIYIFNMFGILHYGILHYWNIAI